MKRKENRREKWKEGKKKEHTTAMTDTHPLRRRGGGSRCFVVVVGLRQVDALLAEDNGWCLGAMVKLTDADDWLTLDWK